ncbi:hypothetical protein GJ744_002028 [Endocarpon pusillum]|uniref:BTB domain-containing protein n=1 Tax=Endocarpon pusillum TaxID=364733 RepID=A0A8H7ACH8_9EURO|nr:hypothetical protein GJ744_002028 [Endocarpon pusillum]
MATSEEAPYRRILSFLESGHFADFTIKCKGHGWKVHKVIISAECGFFRRMCMSNFKEAVEGAVDFPEDDPKLIARLILFLYTEYYPVWKPGQAQGNAGKVASSQWMKSLRELLHSEDIFINKEQGEMCESMGTESMAIDTWMHALADRLDVPKLAAEAQKNYGQARSRMEDLCSVEDFAASVKVVYQTTSTTDRRLRDIALFSVQEDLGWLQRSSSVTDTDEEDEWLLDLLRSTPEYAIQLLAIDVKRVVVWCELCQRKISVVNLCSCGMRGLCGDVDCTTGAWTSISCWLCGKTGGWRKATMDDPEECEYMNEE